MKLATRLARIAADTAAMMLVLSGYACVITAIRLASLLDDREDEA